MRTHSSRTASSILTAWKFTDVFLPSVALQTVSDSVTALKVQEETTRPNSGSCWSPSGFQALGLPISCKSVCRFDVRPDARVATQQWLYGRRARKLLGKAMARGVDFPSCRRGFCHTAS